MSRAFARFLLALSLSGFVCGSAAQQAGNNESPCLASKIVSVPNRPTVASATDTTQCGTLEAEYGTERQWLGGGAHRGDLTGGLRLGLTPNLDLHWASGDYLSFDGMPGSESGFGDTWLGLKYRYLTQTRARPSLGIFYTAKIPTASAAYGLGSGRFDHSLALLVSKDIHPFHFDFNVIPQLVGRPAAAGYDHNVGLALANWLPLTRRFSLVAEPYGYTALNAGTPAFSSLMLGGTYQLNPRVVLDTGVDAGMTHGAPQKRVYVGATCALANVYAPFRSRGRSSPSPAR
ncbi:MAG TPA: transporter [Verrucomicrobiae bacterium]|nr:transporter [Verrucomicrobiae bacterium]